jgi:PAS domain S-box-containing protein
MLVAVCVLVGVVVSVIGLWRVGTEASQQIERLSIASAESSQWALAQSEVEALRFRIAIAQALARDGSAGLQDVRRNFDIFYARLSILEAGQVFASLREQEQIGLAIRDVRAKLDEIVLYIDGSDDVLRAALPALEEEAEAISKTLRFVAVEGVGVFSRFSVERRGSVSEVVRDLAVFASLEVGFLLVCLVALLFLLFLTSRAREEIASAEDRLRVVVETAIDAVVVMDRYGRLLDYNGAAQEIFGYSRSEAVGRPLSSIILPNPDESATLAPRETSHRPKDLLGGGGIVQLRGRSKSGRQFPVEVATATAQSADGEILVSFMRDISERVRAEQELVEARDRALAGEKAKLDLLAVMSHEMRTPINGIMGSLEILGETALDEKQREFLEAMSISGHMLLRHVNAVLDISRIDAERFELVESDFRPDAVIADVVSSLSGQAASRGNSIQFEMLGDDIGLCRGDANRFEQIAANLIGNAVKFTQDGRISIELERLPERDLIELRVADTGIGIADEDLDRVFAEFVTVDATYARTVEGSGLGLAIARRLARMMRGEIGVESEIGEGSVFWVRLPLPVSKATDECPNDAPRDGAPAMTGQDTSARVLLVEDNRINRLVAREMLKNLHCDVTEARDGRAAIDAANGQVFDLILMDISMPGMTGIEAAEAIRKDSRYNASTPILAMTAHAQPEDIEGFLDAGMSEVLVKPVSKQALANALARGGRRIAHAPMADAGEANVQEELIATLGKAEAAKIIAKVQEEIRQGLARLLDRRRDAEGDDADSDPAAAIHQMAGLAAIAGLTSVRVALIAAQEAARGGNPSGKRAHLKAAQEELSLGHAPASPGNFGPA